MVGIMNKKIIKIKMTGGPGDPWRDDAWSDTLTMTKAKEMKDSL